jgi:hypothetical protein
MTQLLTTMRHFHAGLVLSEVMFLLTKVVKIGSAVSKTTLLVGIPIPKDQILVNTQTDSSSYTLFVTTQLLDLTHAGLTLFTISLRKAMTLLLM